MIQVLGFRSAITVGDLRRKICAPRKKHLDLEQVAGLRERGETLKEYSESSERVWCTEVLGLQVIENA